MNVGTAMFLNLYVAQNFRQTVKDAIIGDVKTVHLTNYQKKS